MLRPEERLVIWERFYDKLLDLFQDVESAIYLDFAPYKAKSMPDKDTPEAQKLFDLLELLEASLKSKVEKTKQEAKEYDNLQKIFEAWELGLCPAVMLSVSQWYMTSSGWMDADAWEHIAKLKEVEGISREDTQRAVDIWNASRVLERKVS